MSMIGFPLLLIPLAIYNIFVFLMPKVAFTSPITSVMLMSGVVWTPTFGDALLALAIILLLFEIIKASKPGTRYLTDHLLSLIVFTGASAEFLFLKALGTSDFFLLTVLTGVEFLAGATIGLRNRRYGTVAAAHETATPERMPPEPVRHEPAIAPSISERLPTFATKRPDVIPPESKPPEMISVSPAPVAKPVPTPVSPPVVSVEAAASRTTERKISEWSMSDLISDKDQAPKLDGPAKSDRSDESKS